MLDIGGNIHLQEVHPVGAYTDRCDLVLNTNSGYGTGLSDKIRITAGGQVIVGGNVGHNESSALLSVHTDASAGANMLSDSSAIYNHNNPAFIHVQNRYNTGTGQEAGIIFHSRSSHNGSWAIYGKRTTSSFKSDLIFRGRSGSSSSASDTLKRFVYTTSSSTTAFTGSDDNSQSLSYTAGAVQVYLNGVLQKLTTDYAETNSTTITFVNAVPSGNVVEIVAFYRTIGTGNSVVNQFTGDGSTTAFTVTTAPVSENNLLVYIDGVYQQKTDYTVSGTTLTMDTAPASGAIIETVCSVGAITSQADLTLTGTLTGVNADLSGTLNVEGHVSLDGSANELRFYEGSNYVGFEAPALSANQIWVLPDADGSSGHALKTDGSGNLSWGTAGGNAFDKIAVSGQTNIEADSTTDTLTFAAGTGITLTTTPGTDTLTITNSATGDNAFGTIAVSGQSNVAADSTNDTLTLEAGSGITLTTDASNDKVTIAGGSGSVFTTDLFTASGSGSALLAYTLSKAPSSEDELISFICQCFCSTNDEVIYTEHGFAMYKISALLRGANPVKVLENERVADVDNILKSCNNKTKIIFLANPNNPTGTFLDSSKIKYLLDNLPDTVLMVIDGAYAEYIENFDGGLSFVENYDNLIILRTFSKIYGLAALRIGWSYSSNSITQILNRVRGPFNVSSPAIAAATAAVLDCDYTRHCVAENLKNREWLSKQLKQLGLSTTNSKANFLLVDFCSENQANKAFDFLKDQNIYVRKVFDYGLKKSLRITIGTDFECKLVKKNIQNFLELSNEI